MKGKNDNKISFIRAIYIIIFIITSVLAIALLAYAGYQMYDRKLNEQLSRDILQDFRNKIGNIEDGVSGSYIYYEADNNISYRIEAELNIPRLSINYPVIAETSDELLKISINKYFGPNPNEIGNYCIAGHNYINNQFFSKLKEIHNGDIMFLTDVTNNRVEYEVYDKYVTNSEDVNCTSQLTNGKREITLITCTNVNDERLVVKAREIEK